ncbi:MAG: hypothetical protein C5B49_02475 [Bdellovibrio sp.]|nr:MAG: hypothetical protein C5B49_02475 [Bdellovibrio sp.]
MKTRPKGFTIIEVVVTLALISILLTLTLGYISNIGTTSAVFLGLSTRDRIWSGFRQISSMPAALRNSARMAFGTTAVNPPLYNCVYGATPNGCATGVESPFVLYSPYYPMDSSGNLQSMNLQIVSMPCLVSSGSCSPAGALTNVWFDVFGNACQPPDPNCIFAVYTSFVPTCGPATLPLNPPANLISPVNYLQPQATCTTADIIQVNFLVALTSTLSSVKASLASILTGKSGTVVVRVKDISFNDPY